MGGQSSGNSTVRNVTEVDPVTQEWRSNIMGAGATNLEAMNDSQTRALSGWNPAMGAAMGVAHANNPYLRGLFDQGVR